MGFFLFRDRDLQNGGDFLNLDGFDDIVHSMEWTFGGNLITSSKDTYMRYFDPRSGSDPVQVFYFYFLMLR